MSYEEYLERSKTIALTTKKEMTVFLSYEETIIRFDALRSKIGDSDYTDIGVMLLESIRCKIQKVLILLEEHVRLVQEHETNPDNKEAVLLHLNKYHELFEAHAMKYKGCIDALSKLKAIEKGS